MAGMCAVSGIAGMGSMTCAGWCVGAAAFVGALVFAAAALVRVADFALGAGVVDAFADFFALGFFAAGFAVFCGVGAGIGIFIPGIPGIPGIACFAVSCWARARSGARPVTSSAASAAERMVSALARARR